MKTSESIKTIAPALLSAQKKMGFAIKDATNPYFKSNYADLGSVMEACKEALNSNGITVLQPVGTDEAWGVYVETILLHESGEYIADRMKVAVKQTNDPQAQGSAITYARRYGLQSMVFIPAQDDDGEGATDHGSTSIKATGSQGKIASGNTPSSMCSVHNLPKKKFFNPALSKWEWKHSKPLEKDAEGSVLKWDSCYGEGWQSDLEPEQQNIPDPTDGF